MRGLGRIVLVHDWLVGMRGGERVLEELCDLLPEAPVYAFFHRPGSVSPRIESHAIHVSRLGRLPGAHRYYRQTLPLLPLAASRLQIEPCDLVISTSHCVAGSVRPPAGARHLSICFSPMRYVWGMEDAYVGSGVRRRAYELLAGPLRAWDRSTASRVHRFVAISEYVRERIKRAYKRSSDVVYPPVDTERFMPAEKPEDYLLVVSALVPYKRVDLVIEACRGRSEELWIAGDGPLRARLRRTAPPNVRFLGWVPDALLPGIVARARALVFPTEDEFGIAPVEAQASGRPVIALARGGARETVIPPGVERAPTGLWFHEQTPEALSDALDRFRELEGLFDPAAIRANACRFSRARFRESILRIIEEERAV
ncbi:MAG: glycosyltransferase [Myxococcota bacterium]